jgi:benzodiazapine receptor
MNQQINPIIFQIVNILAVIFALVFNSFVNIIALFGVTTAQVSDAYPSLFTPANYVFSIWGVIYVTAVIFAIYQVRSSQRNAAYLPEMNFLYLAGSLLNVAWLVVWHYSYSQPLFLIYTVLLMVLLLVSLLAIYHRLGIGVKEVPRNQRLAVNLHLSIYLGWICIAMVANLASTLNVFVPGIPIEMQVLWTVLVIVVALVLTLLMLYLRRDIVFSMVVIWAAIGIAYKQLAIPLIAGTALATILIIVIVIIVSPLIKKTNLRKYYI